MKLLDSIFGIKTYIDAIGCQLADMSRSSRYNAPSDEEDLLPFLFITFDKLHSEVDKTIIETQQMITYILTNNSFDIKNTVEKIDKSKPKSNDDPNSP
jgi:hypothetical protein